MSDNESGGIVPVADERDAWIADPFFQELVSAEVASKVQEYEQEMKDLRLQTAPITWGKVDRYERWAWFWMGAGAVLILDVVGLLWYAAVTA